jgi:hypothetical protein
MGNCNTCEYENPVNPVSALLTLLTAFTAFRPFLFGSLLMPLVDIMKYRQTNFPKSILEII